ncbi:MAG: hypothetical protein Q4D46_01800 [Erysipelotrichaceae bacterium]|nr:hypothetical protein [Erysipelotrichaceae bacterium]
MKVVENSKKKKGRFTLFVILAALLVVACAAGYFVIQDKKKTINLEDYVMMPSYTGLNGEASIEKIELDQTTLEKKVHEILGEDEYVDMYDLVSRISLGYNQNLDSLSNNDEITVTLNYDKSALKNAFKINFTGTEKVFVVAGLLDYVDMDPFEDLSILFEGTAPLAKVNKFVSDNPIFSYGKFYALKVNGKDANGALMDIGDVLTIELSDDGVKAMKDRGFVPSNMSVSYTLSKTDVNWYLTSASELQEATFEKLKAQGKDECIANFAKKNLNYEPEYVKAYVLIPKDDKWGRICVYLMVLVYLYEVAAETDEPAETDEEAAETEPAEVLTETRYIAIETPAVVNLKLADAEQKTPEQTYTPDFSGSYYYDDPDALYTDRIQKNVADYTYEEIQ